MKNPLPTQNTGLSAELVRKLENRCMRCPRSAPEGENHCERCAKVVAKAQKSYNAGRASRGKCHDCSRKATSGRRCTRCAARHSKREKDRRARGDDQSGRVEDRKGPLVLENRGRFSVEKTDDYSAQRYIGRDRRGAPSKEDRERDIVKDALTARGEIDKFLTAFQIVTSDEVKNLPRIQRDHAKRLARDHAEYAARFLDSIVEQLGG